MERLILVKHGRPVIAPGRPRSSWRLSAEGRAAARRLAARLDPLSPARLVSSAEPKAAETARILGEALGLSAAVDPDFGEHRADEGAFLAPEVFEAEVAALFARPAHRVMGEETGAAARARFATALARHGLPDGDTAIVVAHGRIITLWLSQELGLEPMAFWRRLGLGCAAVVEGGRCEILEP